jgi:hypothetical protein
LTGGGQRIVNRVDEKRACRFELTGEYGGFVLGLTDDLDARAHGSQRSAFVGRRIVGHADRRREAQGPGDIGDSPAMITGRVCDDTPGGVDVLMGQDHIGRSAYLESAGGLGGFQFESDPGSGETTQIEGGDHRCPVGNVDDPLCSHPHVVDGGATHGFTNN